MTHLLVFVVLLACRNEKKAQKAIEEINQAKAESPVWMNTKTDPNANEENVIFMKLDTSSVASVREFVEQFKSKKFASLDILMNNAGAVVPFFNTTDGFTAQWQTNYIGPFLLTNLLMDELKKSDDGRIVNVASMAQRALDFDNLNMFGSEGQLASWNMYERTKLSNIMFSAKLQRLLDEKNWKNVHSNSLHPGLVSTNFMSNMHWTLGYVSKAFELVFMQSQWGGAQTQLHVATSPSLKNVGGEYFNRLAIAQPIAAGLVEADQDRLWEWTVNALNLTGDENFANRN
eukprot:TRINITY_DN1788_c0_g1_i1.p1 TRINITY_DN1788_c0_g1~~TRINITY_DN1788_c0_g1_i1.p1  ORF type:complete len:288 (-),score=100.88 TRINITY_DN1788_c0_g1_i1:2-865(-)